MISKEHKKHSDITRPSYGNFNRNEWAIVGGQCNATKILADEIIKSLSPRYKAAYADAKHVAENDANILPQHLANGAISEYTNHVNYHELNYTKAFNHFQYRYLFNDADIVLVNGNHFEAKSQIVVIDESKKTSLKKRLSQLTNVELILLANNENEVFDFIKENIPSLDQIPVYKLQEITRIVEFFKKNLEGAIPPLNGLVLAGGMSVRMGYDKSKIAWHGKEQRYYLADILKGLCDEVFISCRGEQQKEIDNNYQTIEDTFINLGPYGAILSAFREQPDKAWMIIACDLPLLNIDTLLYLKEHRNFSSMATSFESPHNHFPEPLIAIWEPKSYPVLLSLLSQGYNCPGKALRNMDTHVLQSQSPEVLTNVNTQADFEKVELLLQNKLQENHAE